MRTMKNKAQDKASNSKLQAPGKLQATSHKPARLNLGARSFPGAWGLVLGVLFFLRPPTSAQSPSWRHPFLSMNLPALSHELLVLALEPDAENVVNMANSAPAYAVSY